MQSIAIQADQLQNLNAVENFVDKQVLPINPHGNGVDGVFNFARWGEHDPRSQLLLGGLKVAAALQGNRLENLNAAENFVDRQVLPINPHGNGVDGVFNFARWGKNDPRSQLLLGGLKVAAALQGNRLQNLNNPVGNFIDRQVLPINPHGNGVDGVFNFARWGENDPRTKMLQGGLKIAEAFQGNNLQLI